MSSFLRSKAGEVKSRAEWQAEIERFWAWAELQNRYICNPRAKTHRAEFKKPKNYFERYAKIIGLEPTASYEGVF